MSVDLNFNPSQYEPMKDREPVPNGKYRAQVVESEMKPTKKGDGRFLQLSWQVMEGEHKGQYIWAQLNLDNPNRQAVEIAQRELTSICQATKTPMLRNSAELHDKPCIITVRVEQKDKNFAPRNRITKYEPDSLSVGAPPVTQPASSATPAASAPAWARKSA